MKLDPETEARVLATPGVIVQGAARGPPPARREAAFQAEVIGFARARRWRVAHFRAAMTKGGRWVTPVQGDGAGFPDLLLARPPRLVAAELKSARGRPTERQLEWLDVLGDCDVQVFVWWDRPGVWDEISRALT